MSIKIDTIINVIVSPEPLQVHRVPTLEKSQSLQGELAQQRPQSMLIASQSEANVIVNPQTGSLHRQVSPVCKSPQFYSPLILQTLVLFVYFVKFWLNDDSIGDQLATVFVILMDGLC